MKNDTRIARTQQHRVEHLRNFLEGSLLQGFAFQACLCFGELLSGVRVMHDERLQNYLAGVKPALIELIRKKWEDLLAEASTNVQRCAGFVAGGDAMIVEEIILLCGLLSDDVFFRDTLEYLGIDVPTLTEMPQDSEIREFLEEIRHEFPTRISRPGTCLVDRNRHWWWTVRRQG
jgi:hypothetical protein